MTMRTTTRTKPDDDDVADSKSILKCSDCVGLGGIASALRIGSERGDEEVQQKIHDGFDNGRRRRAAREAGPDLGRRPFAE